MAITKFFYDLETTGLNFKQHSIVQVAGLFEVDGEIVERINLKMQPHPKAKIDPQALKATRLTEAEAMSWPKQNLVFNKFRATLNKYVDRFDRADKI